MEKIDFENLPSTNTPLSAENLNLLQTNVEDAINDNTDMLIGNKPAGNMIVDSIRSKNMFNKNNVTQKFIIKSDGTYYRDGSYNTSEYIGVKPSQEYTYSRASSGGSSAGVAFYDNNKNFISLTSWSSYTSNTSITFQTTNNTYYVRICDLNTLLNSMQLEEGNIATQFFPYQYLDNSNLHVKAGSNGSTGTGLRITFTNQSQQYFIFGKSYKNSQDRFWEYHIGLNNGGVIGAGQVFYNDISNNLSAVPTIDNANLYIDIPCGSYTQVLIISSDYFDVIGI